MRKQFIILTCILLLTASQVSAQFSEPSDNNDLRKEQWMMDKYGSATAKLLSSDSGFTLGTFKGLFDSDGNAAGDIEGRLETFTPIACDFTLSSTGNPSDLLWGNGTHLEMFSPVFGTGGFGIEFPDQRSGLICKDFDGDGRGEVMGMNFQNGEIVLQVFEWNPATDSIDQMSVNVVDAVVAVTNAGEIYCNDDTDGEAGVEWRCMFQGWKTNTDSFSWAVSYLLDAGEDNFRFGDSEQLNSNQTWIQNARYNSLGHPIEDGTLLRFYPYYGDRLFELEYSKPLEGFGIVDSVTYVIFIQDAKVLNHYKRGSNIDPFFDHYFEHIAVLSNRVGSTTNTLDLVDGADLTANITSSSNIGDAAFAAGCSRRINVAEDKMFLHDKDGDTYKDVFFKGISNENIGGGPPDQRSHDCIGWYDINGNDTDIIIEDNGDFATGGRCDWGGGTTQDDCYTSGAYKVHDWQIVDLDDDGDFEVLPISYESDTYGVIGVTLRFFGIDSGNLGTVSSLITPDSNRGAILADMIGDSFLYFFVPRLGGFYQHGNALAINYSPSFSYDSPEGCGSYAGNPDNTCQIDVGTNVTFNITASDPESDLIFFAYDCDLDDGQGAKNFTTYNLTSTNFTCSYNIRRTVTTRVWVDDIAQYSAGALESTFVNVTAEGGAICVTNGVCEFSAGENIDNCPTDCFECNDNVDNDNDTLIDFPADLECSGPTDNGEDVVETNACGDSIDNDGDGKTDFPDDPGCSDGADNDESDDPECFDGIDNDVDNFTDYPDDPGCTSIFDDFEGDDPECNDQLDNDGDGFVDLDDGGCDDIFDDDEETDPGLSYYFPNSWWPQYNRDEDNDGNQQFASEGTWFWDGTFSVSTERLTVKGDDWQPLVADFDGDETNEFFIIDDGEIFIFNGTNGATEFELDLINVGIGTDHLDAQPIAHQIGDFVYIIAVDEDQIITLNYAFGGMLKVAESSVVSPGLNMSGGKCRGNFCWFITNNNKVLRYNVLNAAFTVYETAASINFNRTQYGEPALGNVDIVDSDELIWTVYDASAEEHKLVVFDTDDLVLDTTFDSDGIEQICKRDVGFPNILALTSNPMIEDLVGNGEFEIVTACAALEFDAPSNYFARGFIEVHEYDGDLYFEDAILDNDAVGIVSLLKTYYMDIPNTTYKGVILGQPLTINYDDGNGFCVRALHYAGDAAEDDNIRGDFKCYNVTGASETITQKFGESCGNNDSFSVLSPCAYVDNLSNACFFDFDECAKMDNAIAANLFGGGEFFDDQDEYINTFGVFDLDSNLTETKFNFSDDLFPINSKLSASDINKDGALDILLTCAGCLLSDLWYSDYSNQLPELIGFTMSSRSPVCIGTNVTFTFQDGIDWDDFEADPVRTQVRESGDPIGTFSSSSFSPQSVYEFDTAGIVSIDVLMTDLYHPDDEFDQLAGFDILVSNDQLNCFDFFPCHFPNCDPTDTPLIEDLDGGIGGGQANNSPNISTLPWTDSILINETFYDTDQGNYESQLTLGNYPGVEFRWDECTERGYRKSSFCPLRIWFWDGLSYIKDIILNNIKIIIVFILLIMFLITLGVVAAKKTGLI